MPLIAPKPQSNKVLVPEGSHAGRCIGLIQIGSVADDFNEGQYVDKIWLTFELTNETHVFKEGEEAKPFTISKEYTHSMGMKSNLRPIVEGVIGTHLSDEEAYAFDIEDLVGKSCLVIVQQGETKNGGRSSWIKGTSPLPKGMTVPPPFNPMKILTYETWDKDYFEKLPSFLKEKMKESRQYKTEFVGESGDANDIPF